MCWICALSFPNLHSLHFLCNKKSEARELSGWRGAEVAFRRLDRQTSTRQSAWTERCLSKRLPGNFLLKFRRSRHSELAALACSACGTPTHLVKKGAHLGDPGGGLLVNHEVAVGQDDEPLAPSREEFVLLQPEQPSPHRPL